MTERGTVQAETNSRERGPLGLATKAGLGLLIGYDFLAVRLRLARTPLPNLVECLRRPPRARLRPREPRRLGEIVYRVLHLGPYRPRCLVISLVFYRMLRRQDTTAELVIGLPPLPTGPEAHAWVEVGGEVVGPPPGRLGHSEMARYGGSRPATGT